MFFVSTTMKGQQAISVSGRRYGLRYYWPVLERDVRQSLAGCIPCAKRKYDNVTKCTPMKIVHSGYLMERIAVDIWEELPNTKKGNKYILVVAD